MGLRADILSIHVNLIQEDMIENFVDGKPLPELVLTKTSDKIWHHQATMS